LAVSYQYVFHNRFWLPFFIIGVILIATALIAPRLLGPLKRLWDKVGDALGRINTTILLFIVFFLMIAPLGFMMRLFGKTQLNTKFKSNADSYWQTSKTGSEGTMKQQF
jgi:hypothetical protein